MSLNNKGKKAKNANNVNDMSAKDNNEKDNKEKDNKKKENSRIIKRLMQYLKRYIAVMLLSMLFALIFSGAALYIPVVTGQCIDIIIGTGLVDFSLLVKKLSIIGIFVAVIALSQWLMSLCNNYVTYTVVRDIRKDAFDKIHRLPISYIDSHSHGDIVSRIVSDVDTFSNGLLMGFTQFFTGVVTIVGTLIFMLTVNVKVTLLVIVLTPISLLVAGFIASRTHGLFVKQSQTRALQTGYINEIIGNEKIVKAFCHENEVIEEFEIINSELEQVSLKATFFTSLTNPSTRFVNNMIYAAITLYGGYLALVGNITVGALTCLLSYANQYTKPFNEISGVFTELQNAIACAGRILDFIDEQEESSDDNNKELPKVNGEIAFKNVYFSYTEDKKLIEDFNLDVLSGKRVAIVGPTGCGKTTVINLLMRFYNPCSGSIVLDNTPIELLTRNSLRSNYGMVLQETWLCHGTIRDNIKMGKPEATDEEMIEAAKACHAHSFIRRLPNGYDTVIGEDMGGLSEGQRQLLCIARVMINIPPLLILDEATSSIDTRTEMKIQDSFAKLMKGRTCFIVAHRLSTIVNSDIILVMKDGKIIEKGSHEELMKMNGFYKQVYLSA